MTVTSFLQTKNLYLRPLIPSDADGPYLRWFNDVEVCRYNSHHAFPYGREGALSYIESMRTSKTDLVLAMVQKSDDRHIGNIALEGIDWVHRGAEFAIVLGERDCWGKGYSKEAGSVLVRHGFYTLNLNRICCGTPAGNLPMRRLAEGIGMKEEGMRVQAMFKNGEYLDVVEYGMIFSDFVRKDGPAR